MCGACDAQVHAAAIFKSHERVEVSKAPITSLDCSEHKDENVRFFCYTCSKPVCRDCKDSILGKHSTHQLVALADAVNDMNDKINATITKALEVFQQYSVELGTLSQKASEQFAKEAEFFAKREKAFKSLSSSATREQENWSLIDERFKSDLDRLQTLKAQSNAVEYFAVAEECKSRFESAVQRYVNHSISVNASLTTLNQSYSGYGVALTTDAKAVKWEAVAAPAKALAIFESTILNADQQAQLSAWYGKLSNAKLLYRASRDGFTSSNFHSRCDNQGATLTVIRSTTAHVFGGYASRPWDSSNRSYNAEGSWLFTLTQLPAAKFPSKQGNQQHMHPHSTYGPIFGQGHDLLVYNNSNSNQSSYSNLNGSSYENLGRDPETALNGTRHFQTAEIEVFQLQ
eukprot:TRINITY_DN27687_c0_g1_i7.p1 TRINITY_DN27687_c0_g1~~TRINITY_DN27687_c0_g1_i7.p1  ORF type:complete len:455 (+),score=89.28 TRINITY_DN27687_c0_g1_i7:165-1367(+)